MTRLSSMLAKAFSHCNEKSSFESAPWSIVFSYGNWDTYFVIFYFKKRIVSGNVSDKTFTVLSDDPVLIQKVLADFADVLPHYKTTSIKGGRTNGPSSG